jgi:alkylhydroperoxidase/carboxymuconolactone decarboxylase family protein YurZ
LKEIILQCAIYAGVPPANHAFKLAQEVFDDMGT